MIVNILLILILPLIINALPFIALLILCNTPIVKASVGTTISISIVMTILNFPAIALACTISTYFIDQEIMKGKTGGGEIFMLFFLVGIFLTLLIIVIGIYFTNRNYQFSKLTKSDLLEDKIINQNEKG